MILGHSMSHMPLQTDSLLPCSSQFFPAGGELPFSSPRSNSKAFACQGEPSLDALIAQVKQLPAGIRTADLGSPAEPSAPQQLRRSTSYGVPTAATGFTSELLPLQQSVQQRLTALQGGMHAAGLMSLPSDSQQLSLAGTNAVRIFGGARPGEAALRESIGGGSSRKSMHLHPLLQHQESSSQSPTKQLSVAVLPSVSCDSSRCQVSSAPNSPEGQNLMRQSSSVAVRSSVAAEIRRFESLQTSRTAKDLIAAYPALKSGAAASTDGHASLQQLQQDQHPADILVSGSTDFHTTAEDSQRARQQQLQQLQDEVARLTNVNNALEELVHETRGALAESQAQLAARQEQLGSMHSSLNDTQDELVETRAVLAESQHAMSVLRSELEVAEKAKANMAEQLEHMTAKVQAQEDQLEFAHQQLESRQQELRTHQEAASSARTANEQLQEQLRAAKDELTATQRELAAAASRLSSEANDAKQAGLEASALKRDMLQLQSDLQRSRQELLEEKQHLRQVQVDADKRSMQLEVQAAEASQQLAVLKERTAAQHSQLERLRDQLMSAESDNATLRSDVANLLSSRQEAAAVKEQLRQLQLESNRRINELESDAADLSQQLMFLRSQNERLSQQLQAAEGNAAALSADLDNARLAAGSVNKSLHDAQIQQQHLQQQFQMQLRQVQQNAQQQLQQLQDKMQQHVERLQQQHQSQMRQMQMQMQHQIDCASSAAAAAAMRHSIDMLGTYPPAGLPGAAAARGPRKLTFEDELQLSIPNSDSPPQYYQQQQMTSSNLCLAGGNAAGRTGDAFSGGTGISSSYMPLTYQPSNSSPEAAWKAESSVQWGPASGAGVGSLAGSGAASASVGGPLSPDSKFGQQSGSSSPVKGGVQQGRGAAVTAAVTGGMSSRGNMVASAAAADSHSWFAGGVRPKSEPSPSTRTVPQQQQQPPPQGFGLQQAPLATGAAATTGSSPFGTEMTAQEIMAHTKQLEDQLLALCQEKDELNREYSKMPLGSGKTIKERQRKAAVEARLEEVDGMISKTRMSLKRILGR